MKRVPQATEDEVSIFGCDILVTPEVLVLLAAKEQENKLLVAVSFKLKIMTGVNMQLSCRQASA